MLRLMGIRAGSCRSQSRYAKLNSSQQRFYTGKSTPNFENRALEPLREKFDAVGAQLGIKHKEDWYNVSTKQLNEVGASGILRHHFDDSIFKAVSNLYPEHDWKRWKFHGTPNTFWNDLQNQRDYLDSVGQKMGIKTLEDWYKITKRKFVEHSDGVALLSARYGDSLRAALKTIYPEHQWHAWMFTQVSSGLWEDPTVRRKFLTWALGQLRPDAADSADQSLSGNIEIWYSVSNEEYRAKFGGKLIDTLYRGCLASAVMDSFPEYSWQPWRFRTIPKGFWKELKNRRRFFNWIMTEKRQLKSMDAWYRLSAAHVIEHGGSGLLKSIYDDSLTEALLDIYPEHSWKPWRFERVPRGFWKAQRERGSNEALRELLETFYKDVEMKSMDDWYRVSLKQLREKGIMHVLSHFGGIFQALSFAFPEHTWKAAKFGVSGKKSRQRELLVAVAELFPHVDIVEEHLIPRAPDAASVGTKPDKKQANFRLDIFIPSLSLAFEYDGEQHFHDRGGLRISQQRLRDRDEAKRVATKAMGISLVSVDYSWDGSSSHLQKFINEQTRKLPE